jgi:hypothetical protein
MVIQSTPSAACRFRDGARYICDLQFAICN